MTGDALTAVVICSDVVGGESALSIASISAGLRERAVTARLALVTDLCADPRSTVLAVRALRPQGVVIACARLADAKSAIRTELAGAGVHPDAVQFADMSLPLRRGDGAVVAQACARLRAAIARLHGTDRGSPVHERVGLASGALSRRGLFSVGSPRRPVAFTGGSAGSQCGACVAACRHHALSWVSGQLAVDESLCVGCGACVPACTCNEMLLNGASLAGLEAAAEVLVEEGLAAGFGLAIVCSHTRESVGLMEPWLPLEVPSLEMVTAGWLLQLLVRGVSVRLSSCDDAECDRSRAELTQLMNELPPARSVRDRAARINLREPEATVTALRQLEAVVPQRLPLGIATGLVEDS